MFWYKLQYCYSIKHVVFASDLHVFESEWQRTLPQYCQNRQRRLPRNICAISATATAANCQNWQRPLPQYCQNWQRPLPQYVCAISATATAAVFMRFIGHCGGLKDMRALMSDLSVNGTTTPHHACTIPIDMHMIPKSSTWSYTLFLLNLIRLIEHEFIYVFPLKLPGELL